jgi:alpha-galactosidase
LNRREFLKSGTAGLSLAASQNTFARNSPLPESRKPEAAESPVDLLLAHQSESGLVTRAELRLSQHWFEAVIPGGTNQLAPATWMDQWLGTRLPFSFDYGGEHSSALLNHWQLERNKTGGDSDLEREEFRWTDPSTGLQVCWETKRFVNFPAVEWVLWFENRGEGDTPILQNIQDLDVKLKHSRGQQPYLVHGAHGGRYKRDDWWPFSQYVPSTIHGDPEFEDGRKIDFGGAYPSSRRHLPFVNIETPEGRGVIVGVGWTGGWAGQIAVDGSELAARFGLKEAHFVLRPGERVRTARILLLVWEGKRLHSQNVLRRLLHKHYIPRLKGGPQKPLVSANTAFAYDGKGLFLTQANEKNLLPLVRPFTQLGAEVFIIDAGWYPGGQWQERLGNWRYCRKRYPRGFLPLSKPLGAANVALGLWFAPEAVCKGTPLFREHPEWLTMLPTIIGGVNLRMDLPEARDWFLKQVDDLIENQGMRCYRQDGYNSYEDVHHGETDERKGLTEIKYIAGLYAMLDTLREKHPDLVMEAAAGAARIDLETLSRFHWHQPCETWLHAEWDQCTAYGTSLWLPGGMFIFYNESTGDYGAWSRFGGQLSLAWDPLDAGFPMALARRQVNLYKRVRKFLSGDFYPLTPVSLDETWMGFQLHRRDLDSGFALVFKRFDSARVLYSVSNSFHLQLRGLRPDSIYRFHCERINKDGSRRGQALANGLDLAFGKAPSAEMIIYQAAS